MALRWLVCTNRHFAPFMKSEFAKHDDNESEETQAETNLINLNKKEKCEKHKPRENTTNEQDET